MASIFFSHGGTDYPFGELFKNQLEQMDSKVYLFEHDQQPGQDIANKVKKQIKDSDILFVLLTKQSQSAPYYVQQEIGFAEGVNKPVIPFVESGTDPRALAMLTGKEFIPFDPNNPYQSLSQAQAYVHNHDMVKLIAEGVGIGLLVGLVVALLIIYYTQQ